MGMGKKMRKKNLDVFRMCVASSAHLPVGASFSFIAIRNLVELFREFAMNVYWRLFGIFLVYHADLIYGKGFANCIHGGIEFEHGDFFLPSYPLLTTELPGQCMQCRCRDGLVVCENESCPHLTCDTPLQMSQYCCPQCPNTARKQEKASSLIFPSTKQSKARKKSDCISGGKYYKEGSAWQPVIGPLGVMACVQCACIRGEVTCKRFQCREQPCSHPRKQFGQCCPVCPIMDDSEGGISNCLPRSSEVFVYRRPKSGKIAELIEYGFIQDGSRNKLELHTWDTRQMGDNVLHVSVVPKTNQSLKDLTIFGSTSYKHWTRFTRRERRLRGHCAINCAEKVVRLEETLKLFPVTIRYRCHSDEIDTSSIA